MGNVRVWATIPWTNLSLRVKVFPRDCDSVYWNLQYSLEVSNNPEGREVDWWYLMVIHARIKDGRVDIRPRDVYLLHQHIGKIALRSQVQYNVFRDDVVPTVEAIMLELNKRTM